MSYYEDPWRNFRLLQSKSIIKEYYHAIHKLNLSSRIAINIKTAFRQAEFYFDNSRSSQPLVKPIINYYACLSLVRGFIMLLSQNKGEHQLHQRHGLTGISWKEVLSKAPIELRDISVRIDRGTFSEFSKILENENFLPLQLAGFLKGVRQNIERTVTISDTVTFFDCVSRNPYLATEFFRLYEDDAEYTPVDYYCMDWRKDEKAALVFLTPENYLAEGRGSLPENYSRMSNAMRNEFLDKENGHVNLEDFHIRGMPYLLAVKQVHANCISGYFVKPMKNDKLLLMLQNLLISSYFLGMLARYFPSDWIGLFEGNDEKGYFPMIKRLMDILENEFPSLIWKEIWLRVNLAT